MASLEMNIPIPKYHARVNFKQWMSDFEAYMACTNVTEDKAKCLLQEYQVEFL